MVPYLLNAIFKVNSFPESSPSFWMRSGACDRSDPDVAIKAYIYNYDFDINLIDPGDRLRGS